MNRKSRETKLKDLEGDTFCSVCQTTVSDSRRHYASLQHSIKRNMRLEEQTVKKGLQKVSRKRRAYKEAIRRASLFGVMDSDDSSEERDKSKRSNRKMTKDSLFVLKALNSRKISPTAYPDVVPKRVASEHSQSSQSVMPLSSQSNQSCELDGRRRAVGEGENAARLTGGKSEVSEQAEDSKTTDPGIPSPNLISENIDEDVENPTDATRSRESISTDAAEEAQLKKEIYGKVAELGKLILKTGKNFVLCVEKQNGEKCWSTSGPKMEADLFARRFGVEKGDVFIDVLKKRDRDAELFSREFDQEDQRPDWIDEDFDEFPEVPDPLATRTLLVENIADHVRNNRLEDTFRPFGIVDNIIVNYDDSGVPFALLFFPHVAIAYDAKMSLSVYDRTFGQNVNGRGGNVNRGMEISFLHLDVEETRGKRIRLYNEEIEGNETMKRKKIVIEDIPPSYSFDYPANHRFEPYRNRMRSVSAPVDGNAVGTGLIYGNSVVVPAGFASEFGCSVPQRLNRSMTYSDERINYHLVNHYDSINHLGAAGAYVDHDGYEEMVFPENYPICADEAKQGISPVSIASKSLSNSLDFSGEAIVIERDQSKGCGKTLPVKKLFPDDDVFYGRSEGIGCNVNTSVHFPENVRAWRAPSVEDCLNPNEFTMPSPPQSTLHGFKENEFDHRKPNIESPICTSVFDRDASEERLARTTPVEEGEMTSIQSSSVDSSSTDVVFPIPVITTPRKSRWSTLPERDENDNKVSSFKSALNNYRLGYM